MEIPRPDRDEAEECRGPSTALRMDSNTGSIPRTGFPRPHIREIGTALVSFACGANVPVPAFPRSIASTFASSSLRAGSVPGSCFLMHQLSSSNSLAHGKQRVCVEDFAEFFAVIDNHEEEIERNRTVRRVDHGCPGAIRVYRIGPGVRGETGIKR
jgi:hypothetical protein